MWYHYYWNYWNYWNHSNLILGNVIDNDINQIINSQKYHKYVKARPIECNGCKIIKKCHGGCKASAEVCNNLNTLNPFIKNNFNGIIKDINK